MSGDSKAEHKTYDVIIVGGRPAGATLAARLGQQGCHVLLVDRASMPSLPAVSSPVIYACTMALLDEIGAPESDYAADTPPIRTVVTEARDDYRAVARIPMDRGRDYAYAIDRARFDGALWAHAAKQPGVTVQDQFVVTDLIWDQGRVVGIKGRAQGEDERAFYADVVVGADGRLSIVARKVDAPLYNTHDEHPTSLYYAYWRNLAPYDVPGPLVMTHGTMDGLGYLLMDSADGLTAVVVEGFSEVLERFSVGPGAAEESYLNMLRHAPRIWARVRNAKRATYVRGVKHVSNYYRQPFGLGWALVGDAAHHKDPLGGQGIYDAVFGARAFANNYLMYRWGTASWEAAMRHYQQTLEAETLPMYHNTLQATRNFEPQGAIQRLLGRYACENPEFVSNLVRVPARMIAPTEVVTVPLLAQTLAKGLIGDARRLTTGDPSPSTIPPLPDQVANRAVDRKLGNVPAMGCFGWMIALPAMMAAYALFPFLRRRK